MQMGKGGWIIVAGGAHTDGVWNNGDGRRAGGERTGRDSERLQYDSSRRKLLIGMK